MNSDSSKQMIIAIKFVQHLFLGRLKQYSGRVEPNAHLLQHEL